MSFTLEELQALKEAYAKGVLQVQYEDKNVRYASGDDMLQRIRRIEEELGLKKKSARLYAESDKGLC